MAIAKITLIGMTDYFQKQHDDLFYQLKLPADISKKTVVGSIIMRGGELPVIWANPYFVQNMIGVWSQKMQPTFTRWAKALTEDYNPIYNYDRYEETTDTETNDVSTSGTTTKKVTGFDSDTLRTNDQTEGTSGAENERNYEHNAHMYGNIGVTTSSELVRGELELRRDFNIYDMIAEAFVNEFCVGVYS